MAKLVFSEDYKHYQIVVLEHGPNDFSYKINDPRTFKTLKTFGGYSNSTDARHAAETTTDTFAVNQAEILLVAAIGSGPAETAILTILNGNYTIVLAS